CFLCEDERDVSNISQAGVGSCLKCPESVSLDLSQGQKVLAHAGAHILYDPSVKRADEPCGICLRPAPLCQFFLTKGRGARGRPKVDRERSTCPVDVSFSYHAAEKSTSGSPCSNVPIACPLCPKSSPAVWRYNLQQHFLRLHANASSVSQYQQLWEISELEHAGLLSVWEGRLTSVVKRTKKSNTAPLRVSDDHRARAAIPL
ncbi:hypothetical protein DFP72DRAFT_788377, partial [Ephemerocybe angulata]